MERINIDTAFTKTLATLKEYRPNHMIHSLTEKEQEELLTYIFKGQGWYIKQAIKNGDKTIVLPGLGTFLYNPLRKIVNAVKRKYKNQLYPHEIKQIIKEEFATFFKENRDPFKMKQPIVYHFDLNKGKTIDINDRYPEL